MASKSKKAPARPEPEPEPAEQAGLPVPVRAAVEALGLDPATVLESKVYPSIDGYPGKVVVITSDYRKYTRVIK